MDKDEIIEIEIRPKKKDSKLAQMRRMRGYTQAMLAEKAGVSLRTLQQYESGARDLSRASYRMVFLLAQTLECDTESIVDME